MTIISHLEINNRIKIIDYQLSDEILYRKKNCKIKDKCLNIWLEISLFL